MHSGRCGYYVIGEEIIWEPPGPFGGGKPAAGGAEGATPQSVSALPFGRMFGRAARLQPAEGKALFDKLIELGLRMNEPQPAKPGDRDDSGIPSGYTYLGQFITHEITFDSTNDMLEPGMKPKNDRTPQIDLDSLYGGQRGRADRPELYKDHARLKLGLTSYVSPPSEMYECDLLRDSKDKENLRKALIGDKRNDENLTLAQTHVAFVKFHNKVVDTLKAAGHEDTGLFECARRAVTRHFQWLVLYDYLPRIADEEVLDCVRRHGLRWFKIDGPDGLYMPLEFSVAAFRIGHSMVRASYEWNRYHPASKGNGAPVNILELFTRTGFSPSPGSFPGPNGAQQLRLPSDWIIDWRRFYDFSPHGYQNPAGVRLNMASRLDTLLNFRLDQVVGFPDTKLEKMQKAITVRNLLRGFYLGLPSGEEVAQRMGETPLTPAQVSDGPHQKLLEDPAFKGRTPLWYYILKEAELAGGTRLGRVGSRIVAETLYGLVRKSPHSILEDPQWRPQFGRRASESKFEMIDLLDFNGDINPLGG